MEQAKAAIQDLTSDSGRKDTTITEHVNPAVTAERVQPTQHEQATTVVDREVHQDHYHTTVQPIADREVLPEKHTHNLVGTEHREYRHDDPDVTKERLDAEAAKFKNTTATSPTEHTQSVNPTVTGEHVHHHVHEVIQPIVQKETIQPSVVHTTVPVHEVHHNEPQHHAASALPPVGMADFKAQGGTLTGRQDRIGKFEGEPETAQTNEGGIGHGSRSDRGHVDDNMASRTEREHRAAEPQTSSTTEARGRAERDSTTDNYDQQTASSDRVDGTDHRKDSSSAGGIGGKKPSLLDRLNPRKDADGDGKAGFMS